MTPRALLEAFDVLAESPGGTQRLRALVLELAVRGKLVPQNPRDQPASTLLKRIAAEKARLVKAGKIRAPKPLPPVREDEVPFAVPDGWAWCRLADVCDIVSGVTKGRKLEGRKTGLYPYARVANVQAGYLDLAVIKEIELPIEELAAYRLIAGDVLLTEGGDWDKLGRSAIWNGEIEDCIHQNHVFRARCLHSGLTSRWVSMFTNSPDGRNYFQACSKQTTNLASINMAQLRNCPLPVPPTDEQRRIVARVDDLMADIDRLEAARGARDGSREALRDAALAALRDAPDAAAVEVAWARVAQRMDELFTAPADIAPLRQTILQLAVRGKLVPQNPRDEPAPALLARIATEKARLIKAGKLRAKEQLSAVSPDEELFETPDGWTWSRLNDLCRFIDYRGKTPQKTASGVRLITAKNIRPGFISPHPAEFVSETTYNQWMTRGFPRQGDVLFTTEAPMGNAAMVDLTEPFALAQRAINLQPYAQLSGRYLMHMLLSPMGRTLIERYATGTTARGIKAAKLRLILIPIPPVAEQQRIVARVDALMALCDQLQTRLGAMHDVQATFAAAAVHHLDT